MRTLVLLLVLLLVGLHLVLPATGLHAEETPAAGHLAQLGLGDHWWCQDVDREDLEGKVVLFVLWGSCVGCRQMAPHMIALAKRLEGEPFHLVLSHSQAISSQAEVIAYLRNNKLSAYAPNVTISKDGGHPSLAVGAFRPYYALFDADGRLLHQGMGSSYNGGDELGMIKRAEALVKQTPALWVGAEPYEHVASLAASVAKARNLGSALKKIEADLARAPDAAHRAELERLQAVLRRYRDRALARTEVLAGMRPAEVLPLLEDLGRTFKGTALAADVEAKRAEWAASASLAKAIELEKEFRKVTKAFERVKESKRTDALIERTVAKLEALIAGVEDVPFTRTVEAYLMDLR